MSPIFCFYSFLLDAFRDRSDKEKRPVVSYGRPFIISLDSYPHGLSTHDFLDLEIRHHHAVDTNAVILKLFIVINYFLLAKLHIFF